ncbi:MAG: bactofilin family protein [Terriglobales bacterium]
MATANPVRLESSHLGKSFRFKGDITGTEDIFIDGEVEGSIQLPGQLVTVGPHGAVNADIQARELVVHGKVKGNAKAHDRIEVSRTGSVLGDLAMSRISIQDGAFIQGRVDIHAATERAGAEKASAEKAPAPRPSPVPPLQTAPLLVQSTLMGVGPGGEARKP